MADLFAWMSDFLSFEIAVIGTTSITLGLMLAFALVAGLVMRIWRKAGGRA